MDKFIRWIIFGVIVALVPLMVAYASLMFKGTADLAKVLGGGELLIAVSAICAGGVGELLGSGDNYRRLKIISGGFTLVALCVSAMLFLSIVDGKQAGTINHELVADFSLVVFAFAIVSCGSSIWLSEP